MKILPTYNLSYLLACVGFFLLPFENLKIAPSAGWPAITPIVLFFAFIFSNKLVVSRAGIGWFGAIIGLSGLGVFSAFLIGEENKYFIDSFFDTLITLLLGYASYQVFCNEAIYNKQVHLIRLEGLLKAFILGSIAALFCSLLILLFRHIYPVPGFIELLTVLLKRNVTAPRFHFLFGEPSFISVHIMGVIIPFLWIAVKYHLEVIKKWLLGILLTYVIFAFPYSGSARFFLDMTLLTTIYLIFKLVTKKDQEVSSIKVGFIFLVLVLIGYIMLSSPWLVKTVTLGRVELKDSLFKTALTDPSLQSRLLLTMSIFNALLEQPIFLIFGTGLGNVAYLYDIGVLLTVMDFPLFTTDNVLGKHYLYNMHLRLIAEFGVFFYLYVLHRLYDKRLIMLYIIMLLCYTQFDSYAFYLVWFYLFIKRIQTMQVIKS